MASAFLLERKCFSISEPTLKEASSTLEDRAFHAEVLPAKWVNIGLPFPTNKIN